MQDSIATVPFTDDGQSLELTAGESIALRDFLAERITCAANELGTGVAYMGVRDGDGKSLERVMRQTAVVGFYGAVLTHNLGFKPALPDELFLDERGMDAIETAAAYAQHMLDEFGWTADPVDEHDWTLLVALGARVSAMADTPGA